LDPTGAPKSFALCGGGVLWRRFDASRWGAVVLATEVGRSLDPEAVLRFEYPVGAAAMDAADGSAHTPRDTLASWM
jgi:hypothetical protein